MPSWAWAVLVSAGGLGVTLVLTIWKFGHGAGKLTTQMELLTKALDALAKEFRDEIKSFRDQIAAVGKQAEALERRLIYVEVRAERGERGLRRTPPEGVPVPSGSGDNGGGGT
jgi:hypothetical protein